VTVDGFKRVYSDNSWLLFRKSGTEPLIRVYSDAPTRDAPRNSPPRGRRFCRRVW
jgi:phosphomannomutase